jgi:hypothetical protein
MRELIPSETILAEVQMGVNAFAYEVCDIPPGMTINEYRRSRRAGADGGPEAGNVADGKARRRARLLLPAGARASLAAGIEA